LEAKQTEILKLEQEIRNCVKCRLHKSRTNAVPGEGSVPSRVMFIGEGPGWHEDQQGRPFVGPAGQFLDELLASIGLKRGQVFITNMVKCRPPNNRDPFPDEIEACWVYLVHQLQLIDPEIIVTLGRHAMYKFFPDDKISRVHGRARKKDGFIYLPLYHPAAALHQGNLRTAIIEDFKQLAVLLEEKTEVQEVKEEASQLTLF